MEGYQNLSDEELIARLRGGDKKIMVYIMDKYNPLLLGKQMRCF